MEFYFAPMEGITNYVYRNAHNSCCNHIDKYFAPFITTKSDPKVTRKDLKDLLPERNNEIHLVPQLMSNHSGDFIRMAEAIEALGYEEINLNLGCPSKTVVTKGKGAGFLADTQVLDRFLDDIFLKVRIHISVKTRLGMEQSEEITHLMDIYNQYPIHELIIHPRLQNDYYNNTPDMERFSYCFLTSKNPVCYNGDIRTVSDFVEFTKNYPKVEKIMIGRGLIQNPDFVRQIKEDRVFDVNRFINFHERIYRDYKETLSGDHNVLFKMKELWVFMIDNFTGQEKQLKKIRKANNLDIYETTVQSIFANALCHQMKY